MELKHTPGPWNAHQTNQARSGVPEFEIHWSDIGECVAEIVHGEADALLIAAAPDLLAALQAAIECGIVPISSASDCGATRHSRQVHVADQIRAAIAKATGVA